MICITLSLKMICITLSFLLYHGVFSLVNADYIHKIKYMYIKKKVKKKGTSYNQE